MDTDGTASGGAKEYLTKSEQLGKDFIRLCKSLGFYAEVKEKWVRYNDKRLLFYRILISADEIIFNLPRKIESQSKQMRQRFKYQCITSITPNALVADGACISVSTKDKTYVCDDNILTHNSTVASQLICNWCINTAEYSVGFYAPTFKQAREQFRRLEKGLKGVPGIDFNRTELTIKFPNNSFVQFQTAENDNMRGSTYGSIIVDEAGFVKDDIFNAGILPTVAVSLSAKTGKLVLVSTPKRKNYFYNYFASEAPNKISIKATSEEGGLISKAVLDQIKINTPPHIYKNEYLAEFLEAGEGIFPYTDCLSESFGTDTTNCVAGIDFGMENDYTVLAIMNAKAELVFLNRWRKTDWDTMITEIADILKRFKVTAAYAETNGIGQMPFNALKKKYVYTKPWVTSNKSKTDIINKLSADFQQGLITIPKIDYLIEELDSYELEYTPSTGKVKYGARPGFNDDCVMALAIANWNRMQRAKMILPK